jgi:hypothetical protein
VQGHASAGAYLAEAFIVSNYEVLIRNDLYAYITIAYAYKLDMKIANFFRYLATFPGNRQATAGCYRMQLSTRSVRICSCQKFPFFSHFPGWYLSMDPQHSFFHTIGFEDPPFGTFNDKTLGIIVVSRSVPYLDARCQASRLTCGTTSLRNCASLSERNCGEMRYRR